MKITIITVAYNSAATIIDTLQSVATQTHQDIEHIIIDGDSKDDTLAIINREGRHVAKVVSEPDKGIYDAMNKGLLLATGDFIGFLNADDILSTPRAIELIAKQAQGADIVFGDLDYVRMEDTKSVVRHWHSGNFQPNLLKFGWMPPHPTFYASRAIIKKNGEFDTKLRIAADYDYMMRCLIYPNIKVGYINAVLVRMRLGGVSNRSLKTIWRKSREDLQVMRRYGIGDIGTLLSKNLRKVSQFWNR